MEGLFDIQTDNTTVKEHINGVDVVWKESFSKCIRLFGIKIHSRRTTYDASERDDKTSNKNIGYKPKSGG
jgi:hypothetical protein